MENEYIEHEKRVAQGKKEQAKNDKEGQKKKAENIRFIKRAISYFVVIFILVFSVWGVVSLVKNSGPAITPGTLGEAIQSNDHIIGNENAKVTLVEYSDFECPACGAYYPMVKQVVEEYKDQVRFVYRHFPLPQHLNAKPAALATEAASLQGKFWEMHDVLFEKQNDWALTPDSSAKFEEYAKNMGLDVEKFNKDRASKEVESRVDHDINVGTRAKINATPTFYINNNKINNPRSYGEFKSIIEESLKNNP